MNQINILKESTQQEKVKFILECHDFIANKGVDDQESKILLKKIQEFFCPFHRLFQKNHKCFFTQYFQRKKLCEREEFLNLLKKKKILTPDNTETPPQSNTLKYLEGTGFEYVPEILSNIFQYLSPKENSKMSGVCKIWRKVSEDELIWKLKYLEMYTVHKSNEENYKIDSEYQKNSTFWKNLTLNSFHNHNLRNPNILSPFYQVQDGLGQAKKLYSSKFSRSGDLLVYGGQHSHLTILETKNIMLNNREKIESNEQYDKNSIDQIVTYQKIALDDIGANVYDLDFSHDEKLVSYSTWKPKLDIFKINSKDRYQITLTDDLRFRFCIFSIKYSPNQNEIASGSTGGLMHISNIEKLQVVETVNVSNNDINSVSFGGSMYHNQIFTGGDDKLVQLFDRRFLEKPVNTFYGHKDSICSVSSKGDGYTFISSSKDQSIKLWDIRKVSKEDSSLQTFSGSHEAFKTLIRCDFSPILSTRQQYIYTGSSDGNIVIYDILTGKEFEKINTHSDVIREVSWHPYYPLLVSSSWDTKLCSTHYSGKKNSISFE